MSLFRRGDFTLHSGQKSRWKICCDALTEEDWDTLAFMVVERVPAFGAVVGIPRGGNALAAALVPYRHPGPRTLIVDDVCSTGASMEAARRDIGGDCLGAVVFARGPVYPTWITPLFRMG